MYFGDFKSLTSCNTKNTLLSTKILVTVVFTLKCQMIRSPQICVEMSRLQLQLCTVTGYQKVGRRIRYTGGNCQELVCGLYI